MNVHMANRKKLQFAVNRFSNRPMLDGRFEAVEAALDQVKFDRLEAETEPAAEEQPALELEDAGE
jgi:hypothetical protein